MYPKSTNYLLITLRDFTAESLCSRQSKIAQTAQLISLNANIIRIFYGFFIAAASAVTPILSFLQCVKTVIAPDMVPIATPR
jgi:hypothetical protein